jgi:hypothetical protein
MYIQIHPNRGRISDPKRFVELYMVKDMTDRGYTKLGNGYRTGRLQLTEAGTSEF